MATYFSDFFEVERSVIDDYGAFDVSLVTDFPLFIDPFLLFNSEKQKYRDLHDAIIKYLIFLRDKALRGVVAEGLLEAWYCFPEVKQTWLGFSKTGNAGSGLGPKFAKSLSSNLNLIFADFGEEKITKSSHLEKVCLIRAGVGRDHISDFTTNLIKGFLCEFTQSFALENLSPRQRRRVPIRNAQFNYETEAWETRTYELPWINGDHVILTPKDLLTRDDNWISREDLHSQFHEIPSAISNKALRDQIANYFDSVLERHRDRDPTKKEVDDAITKTLTKFPVLLDYYILYKEQHGDSAISESSAKVRLSEQFFVRQVGDLQKLLHMHTGFYGVAGDTYEEAQERIAYLKDMVENKGCHRIFYVGGKPIGTEETLQIMYRLVWRGTPSDVSREVNDGRGPADFKISRGAKDKTIVEMKLARNTKLERNLLKQAEIYQRASDAKSSIKVIVYFSEDELLRVRRIIKKLGLESCRDVVLVDARFDNKASASLA